MTRVLSSAALEDTIILQCNDIEGATEGGGVEKSVRMAAFTVCHLDQLDLGD